jgi:hypothetical protein
MKVNKRVPEVCDYVVSVYVLPVANTLNFLFEADSIKTQSSFFEFVTMYEDKFINLQKREK